MIPNLQHLDKFTEILSDYNISEEGRALLADLKLVLLVSVTSAGRNTIIDELLKTDLYEYIVSDTTRPPRQKDGQTIEEEGVRYRFRSESDFLKDLEAGNYLEAAVIHSQQVSGISLDSLSSAAEHDKIAINEVEIDGAKTVNSVKPDTNIICVLPPSPEEWMERLKQRSDMTTDEINNRLMSAEKELQAFLEEPFYKYVINDEYHHATETIRKIVEEDEYNEVDQQAGKDLAWKLLGWVKQQLNS